MRLSRYWLPFLLLLAVTPRLHALTYGDVSGDGQVDVQDAILTLRITVNLLEPTPDQVHAADISPLTPEGVFGDKGVDVTDAIRILRRIVGIDTEPVWPGEKSVWDEGPTPTGTVPLPGSFDVAVPADTPHDFTLPGGFNVKLHMTDPPGPQAAIRFVDANRHLLLDVPLDSGTGDVAAGLPAGDYNVLYTELLSGSFSFIEASTGLTLHVKDDVAQDVARPALPETFAVQGKVQAPDGFPPPTDFEFAQTADASGNPLGYPGGSLISVFGNDTRIVGRLPAGSYAANLRYNRADYFLGTVSQEAVKVAGDAAPALTLPPLAGLSGGVLLESGEAPPDGAAVVIANDPANPSRYGYGYVMGGQYTMVLGQGAYNVTVNLDEAVGGQVDHTWTLNLGALTFDEDTSRDVAFPVFPSARVRLSGKVFGPDGAAMTSGKVTATSTRLEGADPALSFTKVAGILGDGFYAVDVPPGDYTVKIEPAPGLPIMGLP